MLEGKVAIVTGAGGGIGREMALALAACAGTGPAPSGGVVKITSLGSHDGELCPLDRAIPPTSATAC